MITGDSAQRQIPPESRAVCHSFATDHGLDVQRIQPPEAGLVFGIERVWEVLEGSATEVADRLIQEATWGCLRTMLKKTRGHALSSVLLYVTGEGASAEVVARTVMEASVHVMYVLRGERNERLGQYLSSYIADQRDKIRKWEGSLGPCSNTEREAHQAGIAQKRAALDGYAAILDSALSEAGVRFNPHAKWPNAFEIFRAIGKEINYRTEYAALCLQTHDAAEDLLNQFVIRSGAPELAPMLELETSSFSRMMVHTGGGYFFEACKHYAEAFRFETAVSVAEQAMQDAKRSTQEAAMECHDAKG